jgi:rhodanese-related sulfurtransferase
VPWSSTSVRPSNVSVTADDADRRFVIVCNEGYSSSLAAHTLQRLGLANATDLCGGYQAWANTVAGRRTNGSAWRDVLLG